MAPMRSHIFDQFKRVSTDRKVTFWYGARSLREAFYEGDFDSIQTAHDNFKVVPGAVRATGRGRVDGLHGLHPPRSSWRTTSRAMPRPRTSSTTSVVPDDAEGLHGHARQPRRRAGEHPLRRLRLGADDDPHGHGRDGGRSEPAVPQRIRHPEGVEAGTRPEDPPGPSLPPRVSVGKVAPRSPQPPLTLPLYLDSDGLSERAAARDALRSRDRGRAWGAARRFAMSPNSCVGVNPNRKAGTRRLPEQAHGRRAYEQIGPDVRWYRLSKDKLDVAVRPVQEQFSASNDDTGIAELRKRLKRHRGALVVIEATGGLEHVVAAALSTSGFCVAIVNPRAGAGVWSRHRSTGQDGQDRR